MKILIVILACLSLGSVFSAGVTGSELDKNRNDITLFDYPFMLGDWYLVNPNPEAGEGDFAYIRLHIASDYQFAIEIQKTDFSVDYWQGEYSISTDTLVLGLNSEEAQTYNYYVNHNQLLLNGVNFHKGYPTALIGNWISEDIQGEDILASNVSKMSLTLQPDFMFLFMAESSDGNLAAYQGVYYYEGDNLVLLYEKGEQSSRYTIDKNTLTLQSDHFDMFAVLNRAE